MAAASQPILGIEPKMYRHFVAMTLLISVGVAIFVDSGKDDSMIAEMKQAKEQADRARAQKAHTGKAKLVDNRSDAAKSRGNDSYLRGQYGAPMDTVGDSGSSYLPPATMSPMPVTVAIDPAVLKKMTPAQRAAYLKQMEQQRQQMEAQGPYRPSPQEISNLTAASAQRSGVGEN